MSRLYLFNLGYYYHYHQYYYLIAPATLSWRGARAPKFLTAAARGVTTHFIGTPLKKFPALPKVIPCP